MRRKPSKYRDMGGEVDGVEAVDGDGEARATLAAAVFTAKHDVGERARGTVEGAGVPLITDMKSADVIVKPARACSGRRSGEHDVGGGVRASAAERDDGVHRAWLVMMQSGGLQP